MMTTAASTTTKLRGQVFAASITDGVTLVPIEMPTTTKQALRIKAGIPSLTPASPVIVTASAGPERKGAGISMRLASSAPMLPTSAVSANVWSSGLMIIATLSVCLKKLATKCAASVHDVNTQDQKYYISCLFT